MSSDFQEQMNPVEALMWSLDADPVLSSTFANITWLDRAPDAERLRRRMWRATRVVPAISGPCTFRQLSRNSSGPHS